ncbi:Retrovirus-related Pol polyprotein from transposon 17.6 [Trichoplax sp. H2]|nr:Retrovirus-related Pol polyprotein from transposon 17.6 [Trichoplax sp. H2]|eukprot:RDD35996.1 Retrovirus-related Pol polyprotein from transposon 17.6 [Trichoplax sp. H2]
MDPELVRICQDMKTNPDMAKTYYINKDGLLMRKCLDGEKIDFENQLVLPRQCRPGVLHMAHDVPLSGHLSYARTIAMDIVGPLPRTKSGKSYILVICDYATRYPEAFPLAKANGRSIAKELGHYFSRFGIPKEILTDQGTEFLNEVLDELYQVLGIERLKTTPYHPQTDGLVERFNQTLKRMLKAYTVEKPGTWDVYLPYLLFAYREVPQASTGFSPFELLYGRKVRGLLDLIREKWVKSDPSSQTPLHYFEELREVLKRNRAWATKNLETSQKRAKRYYDKNARQVEYQAGDKVLLIRPVKSDKMSLCWDGPYTVIRRIGAVNYELATPNSRKKIKVVHVNLTKPWKERNYQVNQSTATPTEEYWSLPYPVAVAQTETLEELIQNVGVTNHQRNTLVKLIQRYPDTFTNRLGRTNLIEHRIELQGTVDPIKQKAYRIPAVKKGILRDAVSDMLRLGVIRASTSPWASPVILVKKPDGTYRPCIDYRKLNAVTKINAYPLPRIDDILDTIGKAKFITTLDLSKGYWQIPVEESSKTCTAFTTPYGLYEFNVMPFGLHNAPATFQSLVNKLFAEHHEYVAVYLDDIVVFDMVWDEHLAHLEIVFEILKAAHLTLRPAKCVFAHGMVTYLGHQIGTGIVKPSKLKIKAVADFPSLKTKRDVRAFLGLTGYYRRFIPKYASISEPLVELILKRNPTTVKWSLEAQQAFLLLKEKLMQEPVLHVADETLPFILQIDASGTGLGAVLTQVHGTEEHPVAYASRKLNSPEKNYSTIEKECLALVWGLRTFQVYLDGQSFEVHSDHQPLVWLHRMRNQNQRLMRWSLLTNQFKFNVRYKAGSSNKNADALSRIT